MSEKIHIYKVFHVQSILIKGWYNLKECDFLR